MIRDKQTVQQLLDLTAQTPAILEALLGPLTDEQLNWQPDDENWSIRRTVEHLYDTDNLAFARRIEYIVANDGGTLPAIEPDQWAREWAPDDCDKDTLLALFRQRRLANCAALRQMEPAALEATVSHTTDGEFAAWDFLLEWPFHDQSHLAQIGDLIKAQIAPAFSPTMHKALNLS